MAEIAVEIPDIVGACALAGYVGKCDAISIREVVETASAGSGAANRARCADIQVTRFRDKASPKIAEALSAAESVGNVRIAVFKTVGVTTTEIMRYELSDTYISRVEHETLDQDLHALLPHLNMTTESQVLPPSDAGVTSLIARYLSTRSVTAREAALPVYGSPRGAALEKEIERIWFNATSITWTYDPSSEDKVVATYSTLTTTTST